MLKFGIEHLLPDGEEASRALLAMFINRGYMEFAKKQKVNPTNLIQICGEMNVKFLSTVKDTLSFLYQVIEQNEDGKTVHKQRLIAQKYGMRTSFTAR